MIWNEIHPLPPSQAYFCPPAESSAVLNHGADSFPSVFHLQGPFQSRNNLFIDMTSNSSLSSMRRMVEQLKLEASVERIKVKRVDRELLGNSIHCFIALIQHIFKKITFRGLFLPDKCCKCLEYL